MEKVDCECCYSNRDCWADLNKKQFLNLIQTLKVTVFRVKGKSTYKNKFVTAGDVYLKEINFKTFESKKRKNIYFVDEVLNIDELTGGFNFQNAWTGGYLTT